MSTEDRAVALARVRAATEEWRKALDVFLRLAAALENAPEAGAVRGMAEELRTARRKAASVARDVQQRLEATIDARCAPVRVPERRPPSLPCAAPPPLPPADDEPITDRMPGGEP